MQGDYEEEDRFNELVEKIKALLKRENLCHNTYIYKKMHRRLVIPLSLIVEESSIAKISNNREEIIAALEQSKLAQVTGGGKQVSLIEWPTVKIHLDSHQGLREIERILQEKDKKYQISKRFDTEQYINLTVFSENLPWLEKLITTIDKNIDYKPADLMEDIKFGVERIRKLKVQHARNKTALGRTKYSLNHPPEVFVRKAIDSSSSQQQEENGNGIHKNGSTAKKIGEKPVRRTNGKGKPRKPKVHDDEFPSLQ